MTQDEEPITPEAADSGLEAPQHRAADPTRKTTETSDPTAADPGNGAD
jgi:hypothetical protein